MPPPPSPFPTPPRLTPDELHYVDSVLEMGEAVIANFEMLDGFFAALVTGPELVMPRLYLPYLLGKDPEGTAASPLTDLDQANHFLQLTTQHWNLQVTTFMEGRPWSLVLDLDSPHLGRDWALGFSRGTELQRGWENLSRAHVGLLGAVAVLANEGVGGGRRKPQPIKPAERNAMLEAIAAGLPILYRETRPDAVPRRRRPVKRAKKKR